MKKCVWCVCFAVFSWGIWAQEEQQPSDPVASGPVVNGIVLSSETGLPIPGVALSIPGIASAITDDEGRFVLSQGEVGDVLQLSVPGYAYKEVLLRKEYVILYWKNVEGMYTAIPLDEVEKKQELVISLHDESFKTVYKKADDPFGEKDWIKSTAALSVLSNNDNYKKTVVSPENLLQDEGLGVNTVLRSGMFGAGGNMYVRGFNSIYASTQPLIVIDGVPFENSLTSPSSIDGNYITPLTGIDVKDIESITVLKDAASIYGSKAANGALLIKTAKATEQATIIDVHAYGGLNQGLSNPYRMMNAFQYRSYLSEMLTTSGRYTSREIQALPYMSQEIPVREKWGVEGNYDYYRYNHDTDWQKEVFRNSVSQNYSLSIKGGDDIALYALSVGFLNHDGIVENTGFSRYNTQFNSELYVVKWLKMRSNMNFAYSNRSLANEGLSPFNPITIGLRKSPITTSYVYNETGILTPNLENADIFGVSNPTALTGEGTTLENKAYRFFGNIGANAALNDYLDLDITFGVTFDKARENIFLPEGGLAHDLLPSAVVTNEMIANVSRYLQYYLDAHVGYHRDFDRKHSVRAYLGGRFQTNSLESDALNAFNSSSDDMHTVGNGKLELASTSGILGDWKWLSFYLNGEYSYLNRYFLSYNMALDGSSRFGKEADGIKMGDNVFGLFPSITGAWLISSENFMFGTNIIELLKLRVGYSVTGNDGIGNYSVRSLYVPQSIIGSQGLVRGNIANPALKWETVNKFNAGVDAALFNERLAVTLDVFYNKTNDMLNWKQNKDYAGITTYAANDGAMKNTGFEVGIQGRIIDRAFKWDLGVNIAKYKNEVTELSEESITNIAGANILTKVGQPIGLFYGYQTNGVYATTVEADAAGLSARGDGSVLIPFTAGDVRFVNQNTDKIIDEADMTIIGDPNPDWYGSIVNRMQWKRLTLNAVFTYSIGNDIYNSIRADAESMIGFDNQTANIANRWSKEGHVTTAPKAVWGDPAGNSRFSDRWIEDGSYLRLKSLSISYDIPLKIRFFRGIQVYATGLNLFTLTKYLGYDPEFSAMQSPLYYGVDVGMTPQPRSFMFGIKLGL
ncbi:MAG: SusC/RagA family TonB-linked outer membrane protein [Bacteroidales bacterium]|nr:SusC/RagA family TonB-linked outer membrane protein [Bacteroidales bacterium]